MCNKLSIKVKGVSRYTPQGSFVPCGVCEECRENLRAGWTFRLRAEFEHLQRKKWWFGFLTLTYRDSCIPHIPLRFVKKDYLKKYLESSKTPLCFSRSDLSKYILGLRQWLIRNYDCVRRKNKKTGEIEKDTALRYLAASELGEHTQRPHYHIIFAFPPEVPAGSVFDYLKKSWEYGFVIPKDCIGGFDTKGRYHNPFVIDSVGAATAYASKYVCKDIGFYNQFNPVEFKYKIVNSDGVEEKLRDYLPFHLQSRSLGACFVENLSDDQKLELLFNGFAFVGEFGLRHLPVYLKNKLIYNNVYIFDKDGKRLCRREANDFFKKYYREIYAKKVDFMEPLVKKCLDNCSKVCASLPIQYRALFGDDYRRICNLGSRTITEYYISCGNVNKAMCFDVPLVDLWFSRYLCVCDSENNYDVMYDAPVINSVFLTALNEYINISFAIMNTWRKPLDSLELENERKIQICKQYFIGE